MRWPWQAALYRRSNGVKGANLRKGTWVLVCSGALLNERTVVIAAHCVTDLGKSTIIKVSDLKVVIGKFYRGDEREEKSQQHLHVSNHGNWERGCIWDGERHSHRMQAVFTDLCMEQ